MSSITLNIKGRDWRFLLLTDRRYDKLHNPDPEQASQGVTIPTTYEVHFRKSSWDVVTIRHELFHVLFNMSLLSSTDLTTDNLQEISAEIVAHHAIEIILWADRITECFLGRE